LDPDPIEVRVRRKEAERPVTRTGDRAEMPLVQRQDIQGPVAPRQNHDRRVGESKAEIGIPVENLGRARDVV